MARYTHVSKNGEICFDHDTQKYHVFDETYTDTIHVCDTLHDAEIAFKSYCAQYLNYVDYDALTDTVDVMVAL